MKRILTTCLCLVLSTIAYTQYTEPVMSINLIANDKISAVNIDQEKFVASIGEITKYCGSEFKTIPETQKIGVLIIFHKEGKPSYSCYSDPKIDATTQANFLNGLNELTVENTKLVDFPIFISLNTKTEGEITSFEDYIDPVKQKLIDYKNADLTTKISLNKAYAINEVLPVLTAYQINVDAQFEGVKNFGNSVAKTDFNTPLNINELTSRNKDYWRATMEMNSGNQLIPITKIFGLVSQGEFDYAKKYIEIIQVYSDPKTITKKYLDEINYRISLFQSELNLEIEKGIKEHDKGEFDKAISIYSGVLKIYPNSAWALYEKYFSENAQNDAAARSLDTSRSHWDHAKVEIYKHNPLYALDVRASNGEEAYLLFRRQEIATLFTKKEDRLKDLYKYAQISTDLGVYDFAAQLFWISSMFDKDNTQNAINNYLYCLNKLGEKELKSNFKGNFEKIFKSIDKEKEQEMKDNFMYKAMKN